MAHLHFCILQPQGDAGVADLQSPLPHRACPSKVLLCLLPGGILQSRALFWALRPLSLEERPLGLAASTLMASLHTGMEAHTGCTAPLATALQLIAA